MPLFPFKKGNGEKEGKKTKDKGNPKKKPDDESPSMVRGKSMNETTMKGENESFSVQVSVSERQLTLQEPQEIKESILQRLRESKRQRETMSLARLDDLADASSGLGSGPGSVRTSHTGATEKRDNTTRCQDPSRPRSRSRSRSRDRQNSSPPIELTLGTKRSRSATRGGKRSPATEVPTEIAVDEEEMANERNRRTSTIKIPANIEVDTEQLNHNSTSRCASSDTIARTVASMTRTRRTSDTSKSVTITTSARPKDSRSSLAKAKAAAALQLQRKSSDETTDLLGMRRAYPGREESHSWSPKRELGRSLPDFSIKKSPRSRLSQHSRSNPQELSPDKVKEEKADGGFWGEGLPRDSEHKEDSSRGRVKRRSLSQRLDRSIRCSMTDSSKDQKKTPSHSRRDRSSPNTRSTRGILDDSKHHRSQTSTRDICTQDNRSRSPPQSGFGKSIKERSSRSFRTSGDRDERSRRGERTSERSTSREFRIDFREHSERIQRSTSNLRSESAQHKEKSQRRERSLSNLRSGFGELKERSQRKEHSISNLKGDKTDLKDRSQRKGRSHSNLRSESTARSTSRLRNRNDPNEGSLGGKRSSDPAAETRIVSRARSSDNETKNERSQRGKRSDLLLDRSTSSRLRNSRRRDTNKSSGLDTSEHLRLHSEEHDRLYRSRRTYESPRADSGSGDERIAENRDKQRRHRRSEKSVGRTNWMEESITPEDLERPESCETVVSDDDLPLMSDVKKTTQKKGSSIRDNHANSPIEVKCR